MKYFLFLLLLSVSSMSNSLHRTRVAYWKQFKSDYQKSFDSQEAEESREEVFWNSLKTISLHNFDFRRGRSKFKMNINQFADMTFDEYSKLFKVNKTMEEYAKKRVKGLKFLPKRIIRSDTAAESLIPSSFDWRDRGAITRVKDQKTCGSCYAMSTVGAIESHNFITNGKLVELSEQEIIDCSGNFGTFQCAGGVSFRVFEYVAEKGISSAANYPYEAESGTCRASVREESVKVKGFGYVKPANHDRTLMRAISEVGPLAVSIDIDHESFMRYSSGIYYDKNCTTEVNHGALLIGYGSENGVDYWIVKNSFGSTWGENGFFRIARNLGSDCGITLVALFPILKKTTQNNLQSQDKYLN